MLNHYSILDIKTNATEEEITKAFHIKAMQFHPDKIQSLIKKLERQNRTAKEIEVITEINTKKYETLKQSYTELMENREQYDLLLNNKIDYLLLKTEEEVIIDKTALANNFNETEFNDLFNKVNKKETVITEKTTCNVNKAYADLLLERDNIECEFIKTTDFNLDYFNNNFYKDEDNVNYNRNSNNNSNNNSIGDVTEYEESTVYNFKNSLSEISESGIINTNANNVTIEDFYKSAEKIIDNRKIIDITTLPDNAFEYNCITL